jgi:transcription elongation factor Elf1
VSRARVRVEAYDEETGVEMKTVKTSKKPLLEYVNCEYCNAATTITDPTVTHRESAGPIWICPTCEKEASTKRGSK